MLEWMTWLAVVILGPGAVAVFAWFVVDYRRLVRQRRHDDGKTRRRR